MEVGVTLRNMGPQSDRQTMLQGTLRAEQLGFESIWITDHIAIPPDDAQGSEGRYTDPLTTLAWLGGATTRIKLGVGVLIVPYRTPLPTAKAIATVHELTGERLLLGLAVGWMDAEFAALGVPRKHRGRLTDEFLSFLDQCFNNDVAEANGQAFLFKPKPAMPPIYMGGSAQYALTRASKFGHGWMPMVRNPERLAKDLEGFDGPVTVMTGLPLQDGDAAREQFQAYQQLGVERLVCALHYNTLAEYELALDQAANVTRV